MLANWDDAVISEEENKPENGSESESILLRLKIKIQNAY